MTRSYLQPSARFPQRLRSVWMSCALALLCMLFLTSAVAAQSTQPAKPLKAGESITDSMPIPISDPGSRRALADAGQPQPTTSNSLGFDLGRLAFAMAIVIALIFLARWFVSWWFVGARAPAASRAVKVLGRTPLAPRQQVTLLQVGRRVIVVGESNGNMHTLASLDDPDEVAQLIGQLHEEQISRANAFGGLFHRAEKKFEESVTEQDLASENAETTKSAEPDTESEVRSELSGLAEKLRSIRAQIRQSSEST